MHLSGHRLQAVSFVGVGAGVVVGVLYDVLQDGSSGDDTDAVF